MGGVVKPITKVFSGLLGGPDLPPVAAAPVTPTIDNSAVQAASAEEARKRANAGRASTIFAGESDTGTSASKILLGSGL